MELIVLGVSFGLLLLKLSSSTTSWPACAKTTAVWLPIKPVPPVRSSFIKGFFVELANFSMRVAQGG